ncbi:tetratricopeptide repeat protein [Tenacibaculum sp. 1_MG-2023]|uniref:tetratricopeptide repeat protein n=1 Tax=Tenacibaculum sp. 1_MG-2023 TaxID=3062653 RepID=UPI0026E3287E|nr:tetratricopeptide repeat protein [Tenacibaculum sp. 1_MG-2023]MDO6676518.1 tetratricopeptide repeat protein [Tenacibaculum sp. 1_MG-2023]
MKKQILALSLGLMSLGAIAQKSELKAAEKAIKKQDFTTALSTLNAIEGSLMMNGEDKYKSKFYFLKGKALAAKKDYKEAGEALNALLAMKENKYTDEAKPILNQLIQEVSKKAVDLYNNKKDYKNAAEDFYLTYVLSPTDTSFAFNAAVSATQAKDYDKAIEYYRELQKIGYTGVEKQYLATDKATGKVESFGNDKARRDLMVKTGNYVKPEVKSSDSKSATIVKNVALILKEQGKTDEAIAAFKDARASNPKDLNLILNEAQLYVEMGKMDKFGELMNEAVALDPENPTLYYNLGVVNFNEGRMDDAKKYYTKAVELKPDYADAYMNLAVVVLDKEKAIVEEMNKNLSNFKKYDELAAKQKEVYKEAIPFLEKADSLNRNAETVKTLMNLYEVLEMSDKASEYRDLYQSMK